MHHNKEISFQFTHGRGRIQVCLFKYLLYLIDNIMLGLNFKIDTFRVEWSYESVPSHVTLS